MTSLRRAFIIARKGAYGNPDTWRSFADIAEEFGDGLASLSSYLEVEQAFIAFFRGLCTVLAAPDVVVADPAVSGPVPDVLGEFRNGSRLPVDLAARLLRSGLRGGSPVCAFVIGACEVRLWVGFDYTLLVEGADDLSSLLKGCLPTILELVGHVDLEDFFITTPADDAFWLALVEQSRQAARPAWLVEQWAQGGHGERWYLVDELTVDTVRGLVYPHSALRGGALIVPSELVRLSELFDPLTSKSADEWNELRVAPAPPLCGPRVPVRPLDARGVFSGKSGDELVTDEVLVFSPWPFFIQRDTWSGGNLIEAVVPGPDGRLWARWPSSTGQH